MNNADREYDMFGPWIFEINDIIDIPDHFKDIIILNDDIKFLIKIPIEMDRRQASPGMILYDKVILLHENYIQFIKQEDTGVKNYKIDYNDISAIKNSKNLLKGKLTLISSEKYPETIDYNIVSSDLIEKIIEIIREIVVDENKIYDLTPLDINQNPLSFFFKNLRNRLEKKEKLNILGYQSESILERYKNNIYTYFKDKIVGTLLHTVLFLTNNRELIIINTQGEIKGNNKKGYKYIHYFIPLKHIKAITIKDDQIYKNIKNIKISISNTVSFKFSLENDIKLSNWVDYLK